MGSLISKPKAPKVKARPLVVTLPVAAPAAVTQSATLPPAATMPDAPDDETTQALARTAGLLERRRGVLSTVLTGFRGILSDTTSGAQRKNLLGE